MSAIVATELERPDLAERADPIAVEVWPEYNRHGDVLNLYWGRLHSDFAAFQFVLYDAAADEVLAQGHSVPCAWDGTTAGLPRGIDGALEGAVRLYESGGAPTALCAMAIEIRPAHQGRGLAARMLAAMAEIAARHGLRDLIAPVRPSWKERYPVTPIDDYVRWTRADGLPLDPWIRVHVRAGGEIVRPEPRSLAISGTVAEWEEWTEMTFPQSGEYVFPRGLALVAIDRERDRGVYYEPNVWMWHRVGATG
jgi:GNAT superfamily N-acetyltransferase